MTTPLEIVATVPLHVALVTPERASATIALTVIDVASVVVPGAGPFIVTISVVRSMLNVIVRVA